MQLPTGDRLQIPTGAETVRLKGYLLLARNTQRDYDEFAELVEMMDPHTAAAVLADIDRYYCVDPESDSPWVATELVRRLADPRPRDGDDDTGPAADRDRVRRRCLTVAVAMLEESR